MDFNYENYSNEYYEVDNIVGHSWDEEGMIFLVKWKGYDHKYNTWEREDSFMQKELITQYLKNIIKKSSSSKTKSTKPPTTKQTQKNLETKCSKQNTRISINASKSTQVMDTIPKSNGNTIDNEYTNNAKHADDSITIKNNNKNYKENFRRCDWQVVDIIRDRRKYTGGKEMLVRWQNKQDNSISFHSWVAERSLDCYGALIRFYSGL